MYNSLIVIVLSSHSRVADPGIPRWDMDGVGDVNLFVKNFPKKLHENERNRTVGGGVSLASPFGSTS